ncbi:cytochrome c3 family protein [Aeoliella mucimassa]|uniref:Doubled CXXCH motif (Paired_CXXCH_1) n=1 Tax=Aeoliella mucimassa TaxID=2527972 RepID=A0A518ATY8_9BACT|nr:cytochrome c3 family protein [Aeoliella mucimassa]QDU58201.1 Doubled CXXCH motif (Paired_CXXCH_1) [Aeoliella mucimassa]
MKRRIAKQGIALWLVITALVAVVLVGAVAFDYVATEPDDALAVASYVGRGQCIDCHQAEYDDFHGSDHDRAMELATEDAVVGDFNNTEFERFGQVTRFFRKGDEYWVNAEGPDGENHDYLIKYTFGIRPLQQYMVEFPDGRVQVLRVSWDTVKNEWFYVPPPDATDERLLPDDPTHWTGIAQNWNTTCAICHSTNLQKNYDVETDTYHTTFSEIDVSCEACHGPGSLHVKLANSNSLFWDRKHGYGLAKLKSLDPTPQLNTCAPCHSRRSEVHPDFRPPEAVDNYYDVSLIHEGLYHADGQILDEVYVYGSFLQSRMYREGIRCSDCHNPHSLKTKFEGNALCAQCHVPAKYDTPTHHHHEVGTLGASCVECHMPETKYMVVDPRRDHSIRVPRPDLTVSLGTPNACNRCHTKVEESAQWAADKVLEWYGPNRPDDPHWAVALAAARQGDPEKEEEILAALDRKTTPEIIKATIYEMLSLYHTPESNEAVDEAIDSPVPKIRQAAIGSVEINSVDEAVKRIGPRLSDSSRIVRIAAARRLLEIPPEMLGNKAAEEFPEAVEEYRQQLLLSSERAGAHQQLAQLARREGKQKKAEQELRLAIRLEPYLSSLRSELALLLSDAGGDQAEINRLRREEIELLKRDAEMLPDNGSIYYRQGVLLYQLGDLVEAEAPSNTAVELEPRVYQYSLWLATLQYELYRRGDEKAYDRALKSVEHLNELDPRRGDAMGLLQALKQLRKQRIQATDKPAE